LRRGQNVGGEREEEGEEGGEGEGREESKWHLNQVLIKAIKLLLCKACNMTRESIG
jgi:hypothetical protein